MKVKPYLWACIGIAAAGVVVLPGKSQQNASSQNSLFQTSTISALLAVYEGETTFDNLKKYGDFGLGTVNALDGEMIALEGEFYQIKADGVAAAVPDSMKTP